MLSMIVLTVAGVLALFLGFSKTKSLILPVAMLGILASAAAYYFYQPLWSEWLLGMMGTFGPPSVFTGLLLACTFLILPFLNVYKLRGSGELGDFTGIILFSVIGGMMMVAHQDLMILFLGIEILSIAMYILAGADRRVIQSNEAAMKYFIMGAFASAIFLFGVGLYYVSTGSFKIFDVKIIAPELYSISILILFVGLAFKLALAPFHFWAPDVYQGAPTIFTATMATLVKIAGFGALFQLLRYHAENVSEWIYWMMILLALLSMLIGNIMAFGQTSVKRLLSYSGIVQAGFILIGFLHTRLENSWMVAFYLVAYVLASLASFFVIYFVENQKGSDDIGEFKGLYHQNPVLAIVFTIALVSFGGVPLTSGFMAKLFVLNHAAGFGSPALVLIALVLAVASMYYYFKLINQFFTSDQSAEKAWDISWGYKGMLIVLSAITLILGLYPFGIYSWIS